MAEAIEAAMSDGNAKIVADNNFRLRPAAQGHAADDQQAVEDVIDGKSDLAFTVAMEILPPIELVDFKTHRRRAGWRPTSPMTEVEEALEAALPSRTGPMPTRAKAPRRRRTIASRSPSSARSSGEPFEGGSAEDVAVQIGCGTFIPGFEEQLVGIAAGEKRKS